MGDCIFCKIVAGIVPCTKIYEDDAVLAFLDISPITKGHTIVIPKQHTETMFTSSTTMLHRTMDVAQLIGNSIVEYADGVNIGINNNSAAGQVVFHWHVHVIPRFNGDGLKHWPGKTYAPGEAELVADEIRRHLPM